MKLVITILVAAIIVTALTRISYGFPYNFLAVLVAIAGGGYLVYLTGEKIDESEP
jgi:hypothetical protein